MSMSDTDLIYHLRRRSDGVAKDAATAIERLDKLSWQQAGEIERLKKELEATKRDLLWTRERYANTERERDELAKAVSRWENWSHTSGVPGGVNVKIGGIG